MPKRGQEQTYLDGQLIFEMALIFHLSSAKRAAATRLSALILRRELASGGVFGQIKEPREGGKLGVRRAEI